MKRTLLELVPRLEKYFQASPELEFLVRRTLRRQRGITIGNSPEENPDIGVCVARWCSPDFIVLLAHELKHGNPGSIWTKARTWRQKQKQLIQDERICFAMQNLVRQQFIFAGFKVTSISLPHTDKEIVDSYTEYYNKEFFKG